MKRYIRNWQLVAFREENLIAESREWKSDISSYNCYFLLLNLNHMTVLSLPPSLYFKKNNETMELVFNLFTEE